MAGHDNPFAAPETRSEAPDWQESGGVWRQGKLLVMDKQAQLPLRCVKSNEPTESTLKRSLTWHHPLLYILVVSPLIYIIVALIVQKSAKIQVPLSEEWKARRRTAILFGWIGAMLGIVMIFIGAGARTNPELIVVAGILVMLGSVIYGVIASRMVTAAKIDKHYVWIKGVSKAYLSELPEWPEAT